MSVYVESYCVQCATTVAQCPLWILITLVPRYLGWCFVAADLNPVLQTLWSFKDRGINRAERVKQEMMELLLSNRIYLFCKLPNQDILASAASVLTIILSSKI